MAEASSTAVKGGKTMSTSRSPLRFPVQLDQRATTESEQTLPDFGSAAQLLEDLIPQAATESEKHFAGNSCNDTDLLRVTLRAEHGATMTVKT